MDFENAANSKQTASLLEGARKRLFETGTRNRLIHVNRAAKRSNKSRKDGAEQRLKNEEARLRLKQEKDVIERGLIGLDGVEWQL